MYETAVTSILVFICAIGIGSISYTFGRIMRQHEDRLEGLSKDIDRHERDILRIDKALIEHINTHKQ